MALLLVSALFLNIAVLIPVCAGLLTNAPWAVESYGPKTPARDILLSVYFSIAILSAILLVFRDPKMIAALLIVQVIYKLSTVLTVGSVSHPVVTANLFIAVFHIVVLVVWWKSGT